jgi:hypothetical protein
MSFATAQTSDAALSLSVKNKMLATMAWLASTGDGFPAILALRRGEKNRYVA